MHHVSSPGNTLQTTPFSSASKTLEGDGVMKREEWMEIGRGGIKERAYR